jgi:hypothetical protein
MRQLGERISLNASYGRMFMDGKIVDNPDEQKVIRKIYDFHSQGHSLRSIAKKLACRKIFNRMPDVNYIGALATITPS